MINKKDKFLIFIFLIVILSILAYIFYPSIQNLYDSSEAGRSGVFKKISELDFFNPDSSTDPVTKRAVGFFGVFFDLIIGKIPAIQGIEPLNVFIVVICIWILMFVTFSDILRNLSFFDSKYTPWIISLVITISAVNLGAIGNLVFILTRILGIFGTLSIYLGLFASFLAFLAVEFGISNFGPWLMKRKAMQSATKSKVKMEENSETVLGALEHYIDFGSRLKGEESSNNN